MFSCAEKYLLPSPFHLIPPSINIMDSFGECHEGKERKSFDIYIWKFHLIFWFLFCEILANLLQATQEIQYKQQLSCCYFLYLSLSDSLQPHGRQHARLLLFFTLSQNLLQCVHWVSYSQYRGNLFKIKSICISCLYMSKYGLYSHKQFIVS